MHIASCKWLAGYNLRSYREYSMDHLLVCQELPLGDLGARVFITFTTLQVILSHVWLVQVSGEHVYTKKSRNLLSLNKIRYHYWLGMFLQMYNEHALYTGYNESGDSPFPWSGGMFNGIKWTVLFIVGTWNISTEMEVWYFDCLQKKKFLWGVVMNLDLPILPCSDLLFQQCVVWGKTQTTQACHDKTI